MDTTSTAAPAAVTTASLDVPGARLHYEVRGSGPAVLLVGAPMDARAFEGLAGLLAADHTVITTDPRGINRSPVDDRGLDSTPQVRADDLARLLTHVAAGPAVVVGSSGGAVSALALVEARPDLVTTVVAHEPPLNELLDDREQVRADVEEVIAIHESGDVVAAMRKFLAMANIFMPEPVFQQVFAGERDAQQVADDEFQHQRMMRPTVRFVPDVERLRAVDTRVVVGIGEASGGQLCERTSTALAGLLGIEPTRFPGGHIGMVEDPAAFAARLREVLAGS